jgi:hypothetical protein
MKDSLQIALLIFVISFAGFRLYQKYYKKGDGKSGDHKKPDSTFASSSKDDDYEPYAKK